MKKRNAFTAFTKKYMELIFKIDCEIVEGRVWGEQWGKRQDNCNRKQ